MRKPAAAFTWEETLFGRPPDDARAAEVPGGGNDEILVRVEDDAVYLSATVGTERVELMPVSCVELDRENVLNVVTSYEGEVCHEAWVESSEKGTGRRRVSRPRSSVRRLAWLGAT